MIIRPRRAVAALLTTCCSLALMGGLPGLSVADDGKTAEQIETLPIGDADLPETRSTETLTRGVTLTSIKRGDTPAAEDEILTTQRGPWNVQVLTIDPRQANGHLAATYGPDLGQTETTSDLAQQTGALAAMNASFFTFTSSKEYPGDPVGTGIFGGKLLSEPQQALPTEHTFMIDSNTQQATIAKLHWSESMTNKGSKHGVALEYLNHPPVVPTECAAMPDQATCTVDGDIAKFDPEIGAATPAGHGLEVVLDDQDCVVEVLDQRGTALQDGQTSLQATGKDVVALELAAGSGCLKSRRSLTDEAGKSFKPRPATFAVTGRYRLITDDTIVAPETFDDFSNRNPRSAAGTTKDGKIILFTVDGRRTTTVGTTLMETAKIAESLGLTNAINLDGGGSTTMVANGKVVNTISGSTERKVGDALIYVDEPYGSDR